MDTPQGSGFQQRWEVQMNLILSPLNFWFTGEYLLHPPTADDAAWYWVICGAAKRFSDEWDAQHPKPENANS